VLARCGVQSSRIFAALWSACVVLSRYVSSPVAATHLVIRKTSNKISRKNWKSKNQSVVPPTRVGKARNHLRVLPFRLFVRLFFVRNPENPYVASRRGLEDQINL